MATSSRNENAAEVVADFRSFLNDALATYSFARFGAMQEYRDHMNMPPGPPENPDRTIHVVLDLNEPLTVLTSIPLSEVRARLKPRGQIERVLGQQVVVFIYSAWEHEYRKRLAQARECPPEELKVPVLGDLRHMRNDILHHHGVATSDNSGRCEVLGHWVTVGEPIFVGGAQLADLWKGMPWSELEAPT